MLLTLALPACAKTGDEARPYGGTSAPGREDIAVKPQPGAPFAAQEDAAAGEAVSDAVVPQDDFGRKIVKTADLGISAKDVRGSATGAQQIAARLGGTILSSQTYHADNAVYADLVIAVPSDRFEEALDDLRGLGEEVTTDTVTGHDVTEEYVDLQSQERNLLAAEQKLLDLYDRADSVQDALAIQREITGIRGQIEQVQGRIQYLKQSTDSSQISLSVQPVASPPKPPPSWDPSLVVARAWTASLAVLQRLATAVLSTLVFGWWLFPVLFVGAWWMRRRLRRPTLVTETTESSRGGS